MAQTPDLSIGPGLSALSVRSKMNERLLALFSSNSGAAEPATMVGGMVWLDTGVSPPVRRIRNTANTAWIAEAAELIPAQTVRGNLTGSASVPADFGMAALRVSIGFPASSAGVGQFVSLYGAPGLALTLPAGGTWAWHYTQRIVATYVFNGTSTGISAGGSAIASASAGLDHWGWAWRVA